MKGIMDIFRMSCHKATELVEKKLLVGLSRTEKVQLTVHKGVCKACKQYEDQSRKIDSLLALENEQIIKGETNIKAPEDLESSILDSLKK